MSSSPTHRRPDTVLEAQFTTAYAYDVSNNVQYVGKAAPGTAKGSLGWQIYKYVYSGSLVTDIQFANGSDSFKFEWDERASYTYS